MSRFGKNISDRHKIVSDSQDLDGSRGNLCRIGHIGIICAIGALFLSSALMSGGIACSGCQPAGPDTWGGPAWAGMPYYYGSDGSLATGSAEGASAQKEDGNGFVKTGYLVDPKEAAKFDLIVDVGTEQRSARIEGAISLPWNELLKEDGNFKSAFEMSQALGEAGISSEDSVVLYGECDTCGGLPVTPFAFWAMRYLGHDKVSILRGGFEGWEASKRPIETSIGHCRFRARRQRPRSIGFFRSARAGCSASGGR